MASTFTSAQSRSSGCASCSQSIWQQSAGPGRVQCTRTHYSTTDRFLNQIPCRNSRIQPLAASSVLEGPVQETIAAKTEYEAVIGIETHVQLNTHTKAFCNCANEYGAEPNAHVCPVCLGHPGTLPVLNEQMVTKAVLAAIGLHCRITRESKFDRKQYFYPDLPKGYQISQYDVPIASDGCVEAVLPDGTTKRIGITRAHLEEDAGKLLHAGSDQLSGSSHSLVDYNRGGVPLLEIVSEPDLRTGEEAAAYGSEIQRIMRFLNVSDGNMQDGSLRCDVNVSVRPKGREAFGTKVEVKNMNSFSGMKRAIDYEIERQVGLIEGGRPQEVVQETRLWDEGQQVTTSMRRKEGLADYRYFPEPDLPALILTEEILEKVQASMPELPAGKRQRYSALGLPIADVLILADDVSTAAYFEAVLAGGADAKQAANWVMRDVMAYCKEQKLTMAEVPFSPAALAEMIALIGDNTISSKIAKEVLPDLLQGAGNSGVKALIEAKGLLQISDPAELEAIVDTVLAANPSQLAEYRAGKTKLQGYFVGQVMKESRGRANPGALNKLLMQKLNSS